MNTDMSCLCNVLGETVVSVLYPETGDYKREEIVLTFLSGRKLTIEFSGARASLSDPKVD